MSRNQELIFWCFFPLYFTGAVVGFMWQFVDTGFIRGNVWFNNIFTPREGR